LPYLFNLALAIDEHGPLTSLSSINFNQLVINCKQLVVDVSKKLVNLVAIIVIFGKYLDILFTVDRKGPVVFALSAASCS
jgi:hypothetical protein